MNDVKVTAWQGDKWLICQRGPAWMYYAESWVQINGNVKWFLITSEHREDSFTLSIESLLMGNLMKSQLSQRCLNMFHPGLKTKTHIRQSLKMYRRWEETSTLVFGGRCLPSWNQVLMAFLIMVTERGYECVSRFYLGPCVKLWVNQERAGLERFSLVLTLDR